MRKSRLERRESGCKGLTLLRHRRSNFSGNCFLKKGKEKCKYSMDELDPRSGCNPRAEANILTLFRQPYSDVN